MIFAKQIDKFIFKCRTETKYRSFITQIAASINSLGVSCLVLSRKHVRFINKHLVNEESDNFVISLSGLHKRIHAILKRQKQEYSDYAYFYGHPYQALGILNVFGERPSEERFDLYGLADLVNKEDYVLDIGCNCGFMAILTSYRTGARAYGLDINPYMIEIGQECASFLNIDQKVTLEAKKIQDFALIEKDEKFSVVYSFATHWTDDENYRVSIEEHLLKIHSLMTVGGTLVFETHCSDVGNSDFYASMEKMREFFEWDEVRQTDKGERELYVMKRL